MGKILKLGLIGAGVIGAVAAVCVLASANLDIDSDFDDFDEDDDHVEDPEIAKELDEE